MAAGAMPTTRARPAAWRPPGGWLLLPLALLLGSNRGGAGAGPQPGSMPQPRRVPQEVKDELCVLEGVENSELTGVSVEDMRAALLLRRSLHVCVHY